MSFLYEAGDLARTPLAAVLLEAWNVKATGTLTVDHGQGTSRLFLHAGVPVGAQVYVGFRPLGQFLLQEGLIDVEILGRSLAEMARSGRKQGEILLELGALSPEALEAALSRQQAAYIAQVAAADAGDFRFDPAAAPPEWTQGVRIAPLRVVLDALERPQAADLVSSALAPADVY